MSIKLNSETIQIRAKIEAAQNLFKEGLNTLSIALETLDEITLGGEDDDLLKKSLSEYPICDHRKAHKMGRAPRIDGDIELKAFILARIDRLTYEHLAVAIAEHFPKERWIGKSAIHSWNSKRLSVFR